MFTSDMRGKCSVVLGSAQHWSSAWCLVVLCLNLVVVTIVELLVCGSDMRGSPAGGSHGWLLVRPPDNSFLTGSFPALSAREAIPTKKKTNIETKACMDPQPHPVGMGMGGTHSNYITLTIPHSE